MQHRFNIDHVNQKKKFIDYRKINLQEYINEGGVADDWTHSRANSLSYEILAMLSKKGPLENRVKFLNQNDDYETKQNTLIDAKQWLNYTRNCFILDLKIISQSLMYHLRLIYILRKFIIIFKLGWKPVTMMNGKINKIDGL